MKRTERIIGHESKSDSIHCWSTGTIPKILPENAEKQRKNKYHPNNDIIEIIQNTERRTVTENTWSPVKVIG